jgi:hypothetical protein
MKTLSQILNAVPAVDLTESHSWKILNTTLHGLGFEAAKGSDLRSFKGLPKDDIYHLYGIPMRAGKWADVWFVILEDGYAVVNDEKVTMFDHMGDAIKAIQKIGVQQKKNAVNEDRSFETFDDKHLKMWLNINWTTAKVGDQFAKELKAAAAEAKKRGLKWMTEEKLSADDDAGVWISDFVKSTDTRFEGKSKKERIKMALGAYYAAQNEEFETEGTQLDEEVDYYKFKQLAILGLLSPGDANKAALGMKAIEGGHPPTQEQKKIIGDTLVLLVSMITGDSAILNKLKKTARDAKTPAA